MKYTTFWDKTLPIREEIGPPGRPSLEEIKIFSFFFKRYLGQGKNIFILGSTPELRDLALKYQSKTVSVDLSFEALLKTRRLMKENYQKEILVKSNWLFVPLASNYFDGFLGDLILENLFLKDWSLFFRQVKRMLKKNGFFILREPFFPQNLDFQEILQDVYRKTLFKKEHPTTLFISFLYLTYSPKDFSLSASLAWQKIKKFFRRKNSLKEKKLFKILQNQVPRWGKKKWFVLKEKDLEKKLSENFEIIEKKWAKDHYFASYFPIWVCQVKK